MKVLIATSTFPVSASDEVPAFVKDQAIHLKRLDPNLEITIHAPHNHYSRTSERQKESAFYQEVRFHYFWPFRLELLAGRGIVPALNANRLLYGQVPFLIVCQFLSLLRLARRQRPDLLYAHWFTPQAVAAALVSKLTGIPFVFTTHASDVSILGKNTFAKKLVRFVCEGAKAYSAVSVGTANKLRDFFIDEEWTHRFSKKLSIVPMGVDVSPLTVGKESIERIREKYSLDQRPMLLYLGRLAEKKGVVYLLEALATLPKQLRNSMQVVIAGDGQLKSELEKKTKRLKLRNVTFIGYVYGEEKECILALAAFLCLPSIVDRFGDSEGFPVALMEGLAAGKIILASDASGGEIMLKDGENGFLFPQKAALELAATLVRALALTKGEAKAFEERGRQLSKQFCWEAIAAKYHRILKGAANDEI